MTVILDGIKIQKEIAEKLRSRLKKLRKIPKLVIFSINPCPESLIYIEKKKEFGNLIGCSVEHIFFGPKTGIRKIKEEIRKNNESDEVDGIIVQLPVVSGLLLDDLLEGISPQKDVDGLCLENTIALYKGDEKIIPATTRGILEILRYYDFPIKGKKVAVIGRSRLVGLPTMLALLNRNATVTVCHSKTKNLAEIVKSSEIVISATGVRNIISSEMMNFEHILIDVGISTGLNNVNIKGDIDSDDVLGKVRAFSPVPGGVGPLTVASLFLNLFDSVEGKVGN